MNKEIIIDRVDVSGCKHYDDGTCCNEDVLTLSCENTNCMYKQLKRKEQECEILEEEKLDRQNALTEMINILYPNADYDELFTAVFNSEYIDKLKEVVEQLKSKEQECERLKKEVEKAHNISRNDTEFLRQRTVEFLDKRKEWAKQLDQLKAELQATKGFVTVGNKQFMQAMEKIEKLEAENEKLKQYKTSKQASYETMQIEWNEAKNEVKKLKAENETKQKALELQKSWIDNLEFQRTNLKQTLTEIKEIAEMQCVCGVNCQDMKIIRQKISEVIKE